MKAAKVRRATTPGRRKRPVDPGEGRGLSDLVEVSAMEEF